MTALTLLPVAGIVVLVACLAMAELHRMAAAPAESAAAESSRKTRVQSWL